MNAIKNITVGHTERLRKPVGFTMLANLVNIVPFCLSIEAVNVIFRACDGSGTPLDTARLWTIFGILAVYMAAMALAERAAYRANFRGAYEMSAEGRISLAEHLRKLSLGFLSRRDPGDLSSMLITDFTMAETGISHHLPQLMGAMVMPVLAFLTLLWIDWRMATAMFVVLPLAIGILLASTRIQQKLSSRQIAAKIEAGNRLEEYLQGIRVMKAYNMVGGRFVRLREAFAQLRRACIRQEALLGPFVLLSITVVRAGLTLMVLCGTYLLLDGTLSLLMFVIFLIVGSRVFDPLTSALTNFAEFRYFSIAGGRILSLMEEPEMTGSRKAPKNGDITLEGVSFAYRDKEVLHDVSLTLPQGSLTALVGPSGSGKSTLMKLCARFYDPQRGHVLFNGVRMDEIEPESLMRHISMYSRMYTCSRIRSATTSASARPTPRTSRSSPRQRRHAATTSSCGCPKGTTRWWEKAAVRFRAGRSSGCLSPVRSSRTHRPSCWTRLPHRSTPKTRSRYSVPSIP